MKPLSFSGYKRFITCPKFYYLHDVKRLRSPGKSSALLFGSMVDDGLNAMLTGTEPKLDLSEWFTEKVHFFNDDFDPDLVDLTQVEKSAKDSGWKGDNVIGMIQDALKAQDTLSDKKYEVLLGACMDSMLAKYHLMLSQYERQILPLIDEVHDVQHEVNLTMPDGDIIGHLDFTATLKDGRKVLFDNKTAKMPYKHGEPKRSAQLALYAHAMGYDHVGFIVMAKQIKKKKVCKKCGFDGTGLMHRTCPKEVDMVRCRGQWDKTGGLEATIQLQIEKIPKRNKHLIVEAMSDSMKLIKGGIYPRNLTACYNMYGKPCPYAKLCWQGSNKGLEKKE